MGFVESKTKLRTRMKSAIDKLRPSKSTIGLSTLFKSEQISSMRVPPVPLPVLTLPASLSRRLVESTIFDNFLRHSILPPKVECFEGDPTRTEEGSRSSTLQDYQSVFTRIHPILDSPIGLGLDSLILKHRSSSHPPHSHLEPSPSPALILSHPAGPFTPELVDNPMLRLLPQYTTTTINPSLTTPSDIKTYFDQAFHHPITPTPDSPTSTYSSSQHSFKASPLIKNQDLHINHQTTTPPQPSRSQSSPHPKFSITPARRFLRRRGPIPNPQSISSRVLQDMVSSHLPPPPPPPSSSSRWETGDEEYLNQLCPGGNPMDLYRLEDSESDPVLIIKLPQLLPVAMIRSRASDLSLRSTVSSFMTHVTVQSSLE